MGVTRMLVRIPDRSNLTQRYKRFATTFNIYASGCVTFALFRRDGQTRYTLGKNTASIMKDLVLNLI